MFDLSGKRALITGASGAIGAAVAGALHARGARVALAGTRREALDAVAAELGEGAHVVTGNLGDPEVVEGLAKQADDAMGGVDILVNNAGITRDTLMMRMKDEDWDQVLDVNLTAAFRLARTCLKGMMKRRWGRIIGMTSVVGVTGNAGQANYAAAKAGMIGMTKSLAQEVAARGVTANCVAPGFIETPMTDEIPEDRREALINSIPAGHLGTPADVANACLFLASQEANYITGQTLHVNGGMAMV